MLRFGNSAAVIAQPATGPFASIDHVQLAMPPGEEDRARGFYRDLLGMNEVRKPPELAKRGGCWFESGAVQIHLGVEADFRPAKKAHPALRCADYDAMAGRLRSAGIPVDESSDIPGVRRAYIHDPFGNRIELVHQEDRRSDFVPLESGGPARPVGRARTMAGTEKPAHSAILLLAHGSPDSPDQVPDFLSRVTGGRELPPEVVGEVKHRYQQIGRSPLTEITLRQGELLARKLDIPVYVGMRNWHPFVDETLQRMISDDIHRAVVICMAPQNSRTSVGLYRASLRGSADTELTFDFVESWHDQPFLIEAFAEKLKAGRDRASREFGSAVPVIFTAHSVPQRTVLEGDPYEVQANRTAELVAAAASLQRSEWRFAFQSQGMSGGAWLGPTVEATIMDLARSGHRAVFVQPVGFVCDHVEVLYDIDIAFKDFAEKQGMRLWRAESLNDSPRLISALADIVKSRLKAAPQ